MRTMASFKVGRVSIVRELPQAAQSLPGELTGEAVSFLRVYLRRKNNRPLQSLFEIIKQVPESKCRAQIKRHLGTSPAKLKTFLESLPQYFSIEQDQVSLLPCKTRGEIEASLQVPRHAGDAQRQPRNICVVTDPAYCAKAVNELLAEKVIGVDCEGECLGITGRLTLVQISTVQGDVFLIDIIADRDKHAMFYLGRLKELLESPDVVKVFHNCRSDSAALYCQFGVTLRNVFDTECAYQVLMDQHNIDVKQPIPGLNHVCQIFGGPLNEVNEDIKYRMSHDHGYWGYRPMSRDMVIYAAADVFALLPDVYYNMKKALDPGWTSQFQQLCQANVDWHFSRHSSGL
ncbi:egalitarian protein homolog [Ptychodera flava]|uniref:egalitarian protein homolog n=1 Tax=Ptychodera flava TaxID=63121 RepID=UPI00396A8F35